MFVGNVSSVIPELGAPDDNLSTTFFSRIFGSKSLCHHSYHKPNLNVGGEDATYGFHSSCWCGLKSCRNNHIGHVLCEARLLNKKTVFLSYK